ncbi:hypothetical protein DDP54_01930 [Cellulomonas sp. WB94]|uniref:hypothetical protein n=1 Tax=Cellulomonas sp. WB94 TaxID=2173174 RepID=UPI000D57820F|nr:hypothetical protein [Cellulomonas sp. WB94]PVU81974.1 hypothetical protein DDP54_01930 [Cellulomonas sp. WB94]
MTVDDLGSDEPLGEVPPVSAELDLAADGLGGGGPMVGIAIRLPVATLDAARQIANDEGVKVTAMLREWIDQRVAERVDDARVVTVADLRRLIAHRAQDLQPGRDVGGDELHAVQSEPARSATAAASKPKAAAVAKPTHVEAAKPKAADGGKHKGKLSAGAKAKAKSKSSGHGSGKGGPKAG